MDLKSEDIFSLTKEAIEDYETKEGNNVGKLTYLSLTSKPEGPIRDRVAWLFQKKIDDEGKNLFSSREFKRYDLAILEPNGNPNRNDPKVKHIYEFKVGSAASFRGDLKQAKKYVDRVISDFQKGSDNKDLDKMTCVFIGVEPLQIVENNEYAFIKYAGRSNSLLKKIEQEDLEEGFIHQEIVNEFNGCDKLEVLESDSIELQPYNGKRLCLHLLILRPNKSRFNLN